MENAALMCSLPWDFIGFSHTEQFVADPTSVQKLPANICEIKTTLFSSHLVYNRWPPVKIKRARQFSYAQRPSKTSTLNNVV